MSDQPVKEEKDYPLLLTADHISEVLQISKRKSYEIMEEKGFPLLKLGRLKRAPREDFFKWIRGQYVKVDLD